MRRIPSIIYLLTSLAVMFVGSATSSGLFSEFYILFHEANRSSIQGAVADAILSFATPVFFLLASASSARAKGGSKRAMWITAAAVPFISSPLVQYGHGLKLYAEVAVALISLVFALWPLVNKPFAIIAIGIVTYGFTQGADFYFWFWKYWNFGGPPSHLLLEVAAPTLVITSLVVAVVSHCVARKGTLRVQTDAR